MKRDQVLNNCASPPGLRAPAGIVESFVSRGIPIVKFYSRFVVHNCIQ